MSFHIRYGNSWYLQDTSIENIYINEYMVSAPGDYVKVYLFARMHAGIGTELSNVTIAMELGMADEDVLKAWTYWESKGVIRKIYPDASDRFNYDVEFLSLKGIAAPEKKPEPVSNVLADEELNGLMLAIEPVLGRTISGSDRDAVKSWLEEYNADLEVIIYACKVAAERDKTAVRYITAIIREWTDAGLCSADEVESYIKGNGQRASQCKRIFKALGFNRNWTENEKKLMDRWFDEYGFSLERILDACSRSSGIPNPNINYVNKVLTNWLEEDSKKKDESSGSSKKIAGSKILKYYEYIRNRHEEEARERRKEVYEKIPEIRKIEEEMQQLNVQMSKAMFGKPGAHRDQIIEEIKKKMDDLDVKKAISLTDNGFTPDYMDIRNLCDECQDTGVNNEGQRCSCYKQRTQEAIEWQKKQK